MQHEKWYFTGLLLGCLVLCLCILGVRWHRLAERVPLAAVPASLAQASTQEPSSGEQPDAAERRSTDTSSRKADQSTTAKHSTAPVAGGSGSEPAGQGAAKAPAAGKLNLNTADAADFEQLPGIGPTLAGRIVEYRRAHGPFKTVDGLLEVEGIGEGKLDAIKELVYAGSGG